MLLPKVAQSYMAAFLRAHSECSKPVHEGFAIQASTSDVVQRVANA
jgi:hypothetical protein